MTPSDILDRLIDKYKSRVLWHKVDASTASEAGHPYLGEENQKGDVAMFEILKSYKELREAIDTWGNTEAALAIMNSDQLLTELGKDHD